MDILPSPLYVGTALEVTQEFQTPVPGTPQANWPFVDPTTVTLTVAGGDGVAPVTYTYGSGPQIVRVSTGVYSFTTDTTVPGRWQFKWVGTDPCAAVTVKGCVLLPQPF